MLDCEYRRVTEVKKDVVAFVVAVRDIGMVQDLVFLNALVKLHDVYLDKVMGDLEKEVALVLEAEDQIQVEVKSAEDLFRNADKYEMDLSAHFGEQHNLAYPVLLPFSLSVVRLNDLVQSYFEDNFAFWQFLLADKGDFPLAYASCDKILCRVIEILSEHFFHKNKFTIL